MLRLTGHLCEITVDLPPLVFDKVFIHKDLPSGSTARNSFDCLNPSESSLLALPHLEREITCEIFKTVLLPFLCAICVWCQLVKGTHKTNLFVPTLN